MTNLRRTMSLLILLALCATPAFAGVVVTANDDITTSSWDPAGFWNTGFKWHQDVPGGETQEFYDIFGPPTHAQITYSYVNLMKGKSSDLIVRSIIEEALGLWASYAILDFTEMVDVGSVGVTDERYDGDEYADIRFGLHDFTGLNASDVAHANYPHIKGELGGDVHFNELQQWSISPVDLPYIDLLEVAVHELGHALGLEHVPAPADGGVEVIMNPQYVGRYNGLGSAYLLPGDIAGIQAIYGPGVGSVTPIPEPTAALVIAISTLAIVSRRK